MPEIRIALTDRSVADLAPAKSGQYVVRDSELAGFFLLVGKRRKTFMIQGDLRAPGGRQSLRVKVGLVGEMTTRKARAAAMEILGKVARGEDPRERSKSADPAVPAEPTLREAWARYRVAHMERKGRGTRTIENYGDHVERLMGDWQDRTLADLGNDPRLVIQRHEKISKANGPYIANGCMRTLRAIYNHARKSCRTLPLENPVNALDWNRERRRDTALGLADLKTWFPQAAALAHPLRREFHLFLLLSGSRPDALKHARPEHIDFRARILHVPKPKGGERKAFDIPLSRAMCRCLIRALRLGRMLYPDQAQDWIFPADSESGHLAEHKENRKTLTNWGNELRQTYRTVGQIAGVGDLDMHLLMNHSVPGVNAGYITRARLLSDHLRGQQEKISGLIMSCVSRQEGAYAWPFQNSRATISLTDEPYEPGKRRAS
ncbi:MAG: integrase arm-type DNA-binding domain-containing protein [Aliidongia sp.]